jgi:hypothetical protein
MNSRRHCSGNWAACVASIISALSPASGTLAFRAAAAVIALPGGVAVGDLPSPNPAPDWITDKCWGELCRASSLSPEWAGLATHVAGEGLGKRHNVFE